MTDLNVHEVLVGGRNLVARHGHMQGQSYGVAGYCMRGALAAVTGDAYARAGCGCALLDRACEAMKPHLLPAPDPTEITQFWPAVEEWSETPGRTEAEVLAAFDCAIAASAPMPSDPFPNCRPEAETGGVDAPRQRAETRQMAAGGTPRPLAAETSE